MICINGVATCNLKEQVSHKQYVVASLYPPTQAQKTKQNVLFDRLSNHGLCVHSQWLVGNVVGRDDTLYARMKQRDLDGHDSMWEPIFMDDAAIGLGDQKNKVT